MKDLPTEIYNAIIAADGKLTKNYAYIAKLRELNERAEKKGDDSDGSSVGAQQFCYQLTGNLFDTKGFNRVLDIAEENGVLARVVEWELGTNVDEQSSVTV